MTRFNAFQVQFDQNLLNTLVQDGNGGVSKITSKYHLPLHPSQCGDFGQSIKDELGKRTGQYDNNIGAVLLGFDNVRLDSHFGTIGLENCYIHIDVTADFYVFLPEKGMILRGMVTKTSKNHIGCLLYKTFNISIPKPDGYKVDWLGNRVKIGNEIEFEISMVDLESRLLHIKAKILKITDASQNLEFISAFAKTQHSPKKKIKFDKHADETTQLKKTKKSKKIIDNNDEEGTPISTKSKMDSQQCEQAPEEIAKKKAKRKSQEDDEVSLGELDVKSLFDGVSIDVTDSSQNMATNEDTKKRKRSKSFSAE